jgi:hypothetical protein
MINMKNIIVEYIESIFQFHIFNTSYNLHTERTVIENNYITQQLGHVDIK